MQVTLSAYGRTSGWSCGGWGQGVPRPLVEGCTEVLLLQRGLGEGGSLQAIEGVGGTRKAMAEV